MTEHYLSRLRVRPDLGRLGPLLLPDDPQARSGALHRLIWTLFPEDCKDRPFLYRDMARAERGRAVGGGEILVLSSLPPVDAQGLFDLDVKPYRPLFQAQDRLEFVLTANPAINRRDAAGKTHRYDVVMDRLHGLPAGTDRTEARRDAVQTAGRVWLEQQGAAAGFRLPDPDSFDGSTLLMDGYEQFSVFRRKGDRIRYSRLDFSGVLEVTDPDLFRTRLTQGFGRARAFGCGLMLLRRRMWG